ncbi:MAG TPA: PqqD family protein [Gemmatimonadaceae bacterium]|nr:PqqD family protein [Gemmatimonadaceae bacterium]
MGMTSGRYHGLTAVGVRVWELVQTPTPISAIIDRIVSEFEVTPVQVEHDLLELFRQMMRHDLIEVRPGSN